MSWVRLCAPWPGAEEVPLEGSAVVTSAQTSHVMLPVKSSQSHSLPVLPIKGSLFHSVGIKTLFTRLPPENSPGDAGRIYELISPF